MTYKVGDEISDEVVQYRPKGRGNKGTAVTNRYKHALRKVQSANGRWIVIGVSPMQDITSANALRTDCTNLKELNLEMDFKTATRNGYRYLVARSTKMTKQEEE
jgi:hypothetical protein